MKAWNEFNREAPELAIIGKKLLFPKRPHVGLAFLATLRKDGAPRLHPVAPVFSDDHLYVFIPSTSLKCADLERDGRYAMQALPPADNKEGEEFYISGLAVCIREQSTRLNIIDRAKVRVNEGEILFELLLERAMYTRLVDPDTPNERAVHRKWRVENKRFGDA